MIDTYILLRWIQEHPSWAISSLAFWMGVLMTGWCIWFLSKK